MFWGVVRVLISIIWINCHSKNLWSVTLYKLCHSRATFFPNGSRIWPKPTPKRPNPSNPGLFLNSPGLFLNSPALFQNSPGLFINTQLIFINSTRIYRKTKKYASSPNPHRLYSTSLVMLWGASGRPRRPFWPFFEKTCTYVRFAWKLVCPMSKPTESTKAEMPCAMMSAIDTLRSASHI